MNNSKLTHLLLAATPGALAGCYDPPLSEERLRQSIVITTRDDAAEFGGYRTFFVRPEIRVLDEDTTTGEASPEPELMPDAAAAPLIQRTREEMLRRGYTEALTPAGADLGLELVYVRAVNSDYFCYYWGDWAYWGYPGWSYYYPYGCTGSSWQSGMLVTHATDMASALAQANAGTDEGLLRGLWYSGVYGVETQSVDFLVDRAAEGISQAFEQSPYLRAMP